MRRKNCQQCLKGQQAGHYAPMYCLPVQKLRERAHPGGRCSCCPPQASSFPSPASTPPAPSPSLERHFSCAPGRRGSSSRSRVLAGGGSRSRPAHSQVGQSPSPTSGCLQVALNTCTQDLHPTRGRSIKRGELGLPSKVYFADREAEGTQVVFPSAVSPYQAPKMLPAPRTRSALNTSRAESPWHTSRRSGQWGFPGVSPQHRGQGGRAPTNQ